MDQTDERHKSIDYSFFFQAEDGIRDLTVTGVQTCALPIYAAHDLKRDRNPHEGHELVHCGIQNRAEQSNETKADDEHERSEERRVGKGVDLGGRRIIKKKK